MSNRHVNRNGKNDNLRTVKYCLNNSFFHPLNTIKHTKQMTDGNRFQVFTEIIHVNTQVNNPHKQGKGVQNDRQ